MALRVNHESNDAAESVIGEVRHFGHYSNERNAEGAYGPEPTDSWRRDVWEFIDKRGLPIIRNYRTDLFRDALILAKLDICKVWLIVRESGTWLTTDEEFIRGCWESNRGNGPAEMWALSIIPSFTYWPADVRVESKFTDCVRAERIG